MRFRRWDHPRSRGEYSGHPSTCQRREGSSPLSRGIPLHGGRASPTHRIIPALAGNTPLPLEQIRPVRDHPRSRGEYPSQKALVHNIDGSSPLSRGIPPPSWQGSSRLGIIPALAGNTAAAVVCDGSTGDHPRSRGEYGRAALPARALSGSSPLSRGIPVAVAACLIIEGIIPALAGNTGSSGLAPLTVSDHPRSRGEYGGHCLPFGAGAGSSPLSRGIRWDRDPQRLQRGIIPALAGNTSVGGRLPRKRQDHPRSRGEYTC